MISLFQSTAPDISLLADYYLILGPNQLFRLKERRWKSTSPCGGTISDTALRITNIRLPHPNSHALDFVQKKNYTLLPSFYKVKIANEAPTINIFQRRAVRRADKVRGETSFNMGRRGVKENSQKLGLKWSRSAASPFRVVSWSRHQRCTEKLRRCIFHLASPVFVVKLSEAIAERGNGNQTHLYNL